MVDDEALTTLSLLGLKNALVHPMADKVDKTPIRTVFGGASDGEHQDPRPARRGAARRPLRRGLRLDRGRQLRDPVSSADEERERPGTIGRPLFGFDVAILGDGDRHLPVGEPRASSVLRGPSTMLGYWKLPEATEEALRSGWLHTGDVMRLDEDGFLYFVDRSKDMIKPGGENVYSIEVETALLRHPEVVDCAVFGVPDAEWGEAVKAIVVLAPGSVGHVRGPRRPLPGEPRPLQAAALVRQVTDAVPRSATAKIVKKDLRAAHDPEQATRLTERS